MTNILLYAPDGVGYGHVSRMANFALSINGYLKTPYLLYISGYYNINYFLPEFSTIDYVKLPYFNKVKLQKQPNFHFIKSNTLELRKAILKTIFKWEQFDYIFIDFFPFGVKDELIDILKEMKKHKVKIILMQRGIIFSKERTEEFFKGDEGINFINDIYHSIICFSDQKIVDINKEYFSNRLTIPIKYVGYIYHSEDYSTYIRSTNNFQKKILINFGGCYLCDQILLSVMDELIQKISIDHIFIVLLGEYLKEETKKNIIEKYGNLQHVKLLNPLPKAELFSTNYDLIIGCGGYNTTVDAIFNQIPIIVIPKFHVNSLEAVLHTKQLALYSDLKILPLEKIKKIKSLLKKTISECPKIPNLSVFDKAKIVEIFDQGDLLL